MLTLTGLTEQLDEDIRNKTLPGTLTPDNEADAIQRAYAFVVQEFARAIMRGNHTGTQLAATISDFTAAVKLLLTPANLPAATLADARGFLALIMPDLKAQFVQLGNTPVPVNAAPAATNVTVTGTPTVGQQLAGSYVYSDAEGDAESGTAKQWFRSDNTSGLNRTAIAGATGSTYTLVSADLGKFIQFAVTVAAATGATTGTITYSGYTAAVAAVPVVGGGLTELRIDSKEESKTPGNVVYNGVTFVPGAPFWSGGGDYNDGSPVAGTANPLAYQNGYYITNQGTLLGTDLTPNSTYNLVLSMQSFDTTSEFNLSIGGVQKESLLNVATAAKNTPNGNADGSRTALQRRYPITTDATGNAQPVVINLAGGAAFIGTAEFVAPGTPSALA
jgi:hypothetical protein